MIKELRYQREAVKELTQKVIKLLDRSGSRKTIVFKAPTGAGKTVMSSQLLDELAQQFSEEGREVAFIWIAPNKLHQQSYLKMRNYFSETRVLRPVMYDELDHSVDGYIRPGEVLFVNWQSINSDNNVMVRESEQSASLYDITRRTQERDVPIIVVIDEEHMFGGRNARQSEKVLRNINPKVELRISATPITAADEKVDVPREDVIAAEMIKDGITINPGLERLAEENSGMLSENEFLLETALQKREEIKKAYEAQGERINPLLLIQLPNDTSETVDAEEQKIIEMVKARLDLSHDINTDNGKLAVWLSKEHCNLEGLENDYNLTEVLLFKQAIALGWDCPRAAVLLIFRDIKSTTFGVQTVGRIMRMPQQRYYPDPVLNHGWVYTNLSRDKIEVVAEDMNYISRSLVSYRRANLCNVSLPSYYSERPAADRNRLGSDFYGILVETFNHEWFKHPVQYELNFDEALFEENDVPAVDTTFMTDTVRNRQRATEIGHIDFENHGIQVQLVSDVDVTGDAGITDARGKTIKYARTHAELISALNGFCKERIPRFESVSVTTLRGCLYQLLEEFLEVFEMDVPRLILYFKNRPHFAEVIDKAVKRYERILDQRQRIAKQRSLKQYTWEVPAEREYNEAANTQVAKTEVGNHATMLFVRLNQASQPERRFEKFLEEHSDAIDWWYKNGDEGKEHYAIPYRPMGSADEEARSLFYIDFVIRMKNGQVFLFDTKSQQSDMEAPAKHNAFLDYAASDENKPLNLKGGVIIEQSGNWYFSPLPIEDTKDPIAQNWSAFHPDNYK